MDKLFAEIKVEDYFDKILSLINHEIEAYSRKTLETMDTDLLTDQLLHVFSSPVPKLFKEKINSSITTEHFDKILTKTGGSMDQEEENDVDTANYSIPFSGPPILFKCIPRKGNGNEVEATVYNGEIQIHLTSNGKMIGNERIQVHIREQFIERVRQIEDTLILLQEDLDHFTVSLKKSISKKLQQKLVSQD